MLFVAWFFDRETRTLEDLALTLGVSKDSPGRWFRGERKPLGTAGEIARRYNIMSWEWASTPRQRVVAVTKRRLDAWAEDIGGDTAAEFLAHFEDAA